MALSFIRGVSFERVTISSSKEYRNILLEENLSICFTLWNVNLKKKRNENNIVESFVSLLSILFNFVDSFIHQWVMLPTFLSIVEKRRRWRIKQGSFFSKGWNILTVTHTRAWGNSVFLAEKVRSENGGPLLHGGDPYARERVKTWRRWNLLGVRAVVTLYRLRWINSTNTQVYLEAVRRFLLTREEESVVCVCFTEMKSWIFHPVLY